MGVSDAKVVSRTPLESNDARWIKLLSTKYLDAAGRERTWEQAERTTRPEGGHVDAVGIVALLQDPSNTQGPSILLEKQFRPAVGKVCIEVPAGLVDPGESIERCATRELKEETGYVGRPIEDAWSVGPLMWNDPGMCGTTVKMVHLSVDMTMPENHDPKPQLEDGEFIECFTVPIGALYEHCKKLAQQDFAIDARVGGLAEGIEIAKRWKL